MGERYPHARLLFAAFDQRLDRQLLLPLFRDAKLARQILSDLGLA
jgi:hypothetical protein